MSVDVRDLKGRVDLRKLAARCVTLRHHTGPQGGDKEELCGPCPRCGGKDRFWVRKDAWGCRQCGQGGDAIDGLKEPVRTIAIRLSRTVTGSGKRFVIEW